MEYKTDAVLDIRGNAIFNASVRVLTESKELATIYDANGSQVNNPLGTDATGEFSFAVPNGKYFFEISVNGKIYETRGPISFFDPMDDGASSISYGNRTVSDKLGEVVSVKDFGAKGDGVTDDHAAIQAAVNSGAKVLHFGEHEYRVSQRIKPVSGQAWVGVEGKTRIKVTDAALSSVSVVMLNADGLEGSLNDFSASGIIFDANGKETGFLAYGAQRVRFTDSRFVNGGTYGCAFQARPGFTITLPQDDIIFTRCGFEDNGSDAPGWDGLDIKWCTNTKLIGCWGDRNTDVGINIRGQEVDVIGCTADGNATAGILLQSSVDTLPSVIRVTGGSATGTTGGPGLELQGNSGFDLHVSVTGFQAHGNPGGTGVRVSGSGKVYGKLDIQSYGNGQHGIEITGDYVGRLLVSGLVTNNGGDGVSTAGKNMTCDALHIIGNAGTGYRERTGADNNYLMPNCVISGNGADIGARIGTEADDGFIAVRTKQAVRLFPGQATGIEAQIDSGGLYTQTVAVGDAASIDYRIVTKGNGQIGLFKDNGARQLALFRQAASATVNYPDFIASATGNAVQLKASGADAHIDLQLTPQGSSGRVKFGTVSASADAAVTGYIEIKDAGGTLRKLAIIA